ncbi:hypothetical protein AVEN_137684-1 [Araneus ventricosus]|uniref:Uncharacterized protein n=1 Tax=Araneus ventricosus TaxID=182803 RepID=A0A4Y2TSG0_ARAVE|nr:hypothetical protein AVEN_137684-1 [Araneus ventricosus]
MGKNLQVMGNYPKQAVFTHIQWRAGERYEPLGRRCNATKANFHIVILRWISEGNGKCILYTVSQEWNDFSRKIVQAAFPEVNTASDRNNVERLNRRLCETGIPLSSRYVRNRTWQ